MKRTITKRTPTAIICSDFHLRETQPICRIDNAEEAQWKKVDYISDLQKQYDCDVYHAGDLFDHWKPSPYLLRETINHLPNEFYTIYGQHDLPQHNLKLVNKCGINVLEAADKLRLLGAFSASIGDHSFSEVIGVHWGQEPPVFKNDGGRKVLVWHKMNYQGRKPWPGSTDPSAASLLRKYPQYDLIVTGDNHKTFHEEFEGRILINPGSLMRMDADQVNHAPCVYLWYADTNTFEVHYLPIKEGVISRAHIERKEKRDARISAFVSKLDGEWKAQMSFEQNLQEFEKVNTIRPEIMEIVYKSIES